jgi:CRP-like cAMP-binding protein
MVGTSRETATRLLSEFNDEDLIKLTGKKITILNEQKLRKTANTFY